MGQLSFLDAEYSGKRKQTRREKLLSETEQVVSWLHWNVRSSRITRRHVTVDSLIPSPPCCVSTACGNGTASATLLLKTRYYEINLMRHFTRLSSERGEDNEAVEKAKACIRAFVEHPSRVIKRQLGHRKTRYCELKKSTAQLHTLFGSIRASQ